MVFAVDFAQKIGEIIIELWRTSVVSKGESDLTSIEYPTISLILTRGQPVSSLCCWSSSTIAVRNTPIKEVIAHMEIGAGKVLNAVAYTKL